MIDTVAASKMVGWELPVPMVRVPTVAGAKAIFEDVQKGSQLAYESALTIYRFAPSPCNEEEKAAMNYIYYAVTKANDPEILTIDPGKPEEEEAVPSLDQVLAEPRKELVEKYKKQLEEETKLTPEDNLTVDEIVKAVKEFHMKGNKHEQESHSEGAVTGGSTEKAGDA